MGRGNSAENVLFGAAPRRSLSPEERKRRQVGVELDDSLVEGDWAKTARLLADNKDLILSEPGDWGRERLDYVAETLPRDDDHLKEATELLKPPSKEEIASALQQSLRQGFDLRDISMGLPRAFLELDNGAPAALSVGQRIAYWEQAYTESYTESNIANRLVDRDRGLQAFLACPSRGQDWQMCLESLVAMRTESHYKRSWARKSLEFVAAAINGQDLYARYSPQGRVIHLTEEECGTRSLCRRDLHGFHYADRGAWRESLEDAGDHELRCCSKCRKVAEGDHPSLTGRREITSPDFDQLAVLQLEVTEKLRREIDKNPKMEPEEFRDLVDAETDDRLLALLGEQLRDLPSEERWRRLCGERLHTDPDLAGLDQFPDFPDTLIRPLLKKISCRASSARGARTEARSLAAETLKVEAGIRDLEEEKREAERERRNWRRWRRGRDNKYKLSDVSHLFVASRDGFTFGGAFTAEPLCGAEVVYDGGPHSRRTGPKGRCPDCRRLAKQRFPASEQ